METKVIGIKNPEESATELMEAARILREGGLVVFPTETVYGLGGTGLDTMAADKISAYIKCLEELRSGNREFAKAEQSLREAVEKYYRYEEVKYFCETFLETFRKTLDELE